jgi:hypothetical protein
MQYPKVRTLAFFVFFINGVLYLGVEMVYKIITSYLFPHSHSQTEPSGLMSYFSLKVLFMSLLSAGCSMVHFFWTLTIYMVSLVLSTIWVQQIFDFLMAEKIKTMKEAAAVKGDMNAIKFVMQLELIKF